MGNGADYRELQELYDRVASLTSSDRMDAFMEGCSKELAGRLLSKVIKRTPVGQYPAGSGKVGGTLRRGWTAGHKAAGASYAKSLKVVKTGSTYTIEIVNPVEYASYVEYGHRTRNHSGWVEGRFFLTISEKEVEQLAPKLLEKKLLTMLKEVLG